MAAAAAAAKMGGGGAGKWAAARVKTAGMMHAAAVLKTVPHGVESTTFLGSSIATEIKDAVPVMHTVDQATFRAALQAVVRAMQDGGSSAEAYAAAAPKGGAEGAAFATVFTGLLCLMRAAVRNKTKVSVVQKDLTEMNVPPPCVKDFVSALRASRFALEDAAVDGSPGFPRVADLKWRIDVAISTSSLQRALVPSVLMQMTLTDGSIRTFEVPLDKFHEMRYGVAKVLQAMGTVESHPVMRIAFEADSKKLEEAAEA